MVNIKTRGLFLIIFLLPLFVKAADIHGVVIDAESGEALPYANVSIRHSNRGTTTDTDGYFVIVNPPENCDTLDVYYIGYAIKTVILSENEGDIGIEVKMSRNLLNTETITVTAEEYQIWKKSDEVSKVTFSPIQINALPSLGEADIFRSLQLLPGISAANDGSSGLYVRGGTPDQNLVLLDGMTIYHVDHFFGFFSAFNSDFIKDVQVYKGGFPAKYGGRLSSVVDLTGKTGNINKKNFSFGLNLISANALFEMPLWNKGSFIISARRSYSDIVQTGFYESIYNMLSNESNTQQTGPGEGRFGGRGFQQEETYPAHYFYDLNSKITYTPNNRNVLSLSFYTGRDNLDNSQEFTNLRFNDAEREDVFGSRINEEYTSWGNIGASLKWSKRWSNRFSTNTIIAGSQYKSDYDRNQTFESGNGSGLDSITVFRGGAFASDEHNQIDDLSLQIDNEWHWAENHRLAFGLSASQITTKYSATIRDTINLFESQGETKQASFYLQDKWRLFPSLDINLGLRSTYYNKGNNFYIEPRISANYAFLPNFSLKGAWGQYNQFIHRITNEEILQGSRDFWLIADEDFEPAFAEHYIAGLAYENKNYLFEIEGYYKDLENTIEFSRRFRDRADFGGLFFFGDGYSKGIEFLAQKKAGAFNGWASYTLSKTERKFENLNDNDPFPAAHDRTHEVKLAGTYALDNWNFSATWVFATGQPYTYPEGQYYLEMLDGEYNSYIHVSEKNDNRLPDYHRMDVSVSRLFYPTDNRDRKKKDSWHGEMGLSVFNLYNHKNVWYREYDLDVTPVLITDVSMLGITPTVFMKIKF